MGKRQMKDRYEDEVVKTENQNSLDKSVVIVETETENQNAANISIVVFDLDNSVVFISPRTSYAQPGPAGPGPGPEPDPVDEPVLEKGKRKRRSDEHLASERECKRRQGSEGGIRDLNRFQPNRKSFIENKTEDYEFSTSIVAHQESGFGFEKRGLYSRDFNDVYHPMSGPGPGPGQGHGLGGERKRKQQDRALIRSSSYYFGPKRWRRQGSLRPIVIDGSNVAMGHGNNQVFSCRGIKLCVEYFFGRGHEQIVAFVPQYRHKRSESKDTYILDELLQWNVLKFTPSREIGGYRCVSYDDRYILQYANDVGGIIISNDQYRDLHQENPHWRETIDKRVLSFTWPQEDYLMFPQDPFGRLGPSLDALLQF